MAASELGRRLVHVSGSIVPGLYLVELLTWPQVKLIAVVVTAVVITLEAIRLFGDLDSRGYELLDRHIYSRLIREYERENPAGYALFAIGGTIAAVLFPPVVAVPAFLMLTIADPVSGLLSDNEYGEPKRPLVLGVTFIICTVIALPFLSALPAIAGAIVATAADGATPVVRGYVVDDNLGIPVGAGVAMWTALQLPV